MKAVYTKPTLELIAFELNEAIAGCHLLVHNNHGHGDCEEGEASFLEEYGNFAPSEDCTNPVEIEGYCYFTSVGSNGSGGITALNS